MFISQREPRRQARHQELLKQHEKAAKKQRRASRINSILYALRPYTFLIGFVVGYFLVFAGFIYFRSL